MKSNRWLAVITIILIVSFTVLLSGCVSLSDFKRFSQGTNNVIKDYMEIDLEKYVIGEWYAEYDISDVMNDGYTMFVENGMNLAKLNIEIVMTFSDNGIVEATFDNEKFDKALDEYIEETEKNIRKYYKENPERISEETNYETYEELDEKLSTEIDARKKIISAYVMMMEVKCCYKVENNKVIIATGEDFDFDNPDKCNVFIRNGNRLVPEGNEYKNYVFTKRK